jgi:methionine synthase II (cobalamin-independent)
MDSYETTDSNGDFSAVAISENYSRGIYALEKRLKAKGGKLPWVKLQTTGPCTFALTVTDENKRAIYYNDEFRDVIVKALAMKCRWQIKMFKPFAEKIICFIDEPILSAFGSSTYVSVKREDVVALLKEMIDAVHADNALAGIHCCGNTEWSILIDAGVDIVNFDAFEYGETIAMYSDKVKLHLERGGILAWGVVPTSKAIREQTVESLEVQLEHVMDNLSSKGIDKKLIAEQAIITPSCGTGSLDPSDAEKVFELTGALAKRMKSKYGF